jgi:hypothetical protein
VIAAEALMGNEPAGTRQARVAQQEDASRVAKNLTGDTIPLHRAIRGPQLRSRPEKMFNLLQGVRLESFRGLSARAGLHADRRPCP